MNLNGYQSIATSTAIYPDRGRFQGLMYCALKLNGEAGEVADKVGKALRDDGGKITEERRRALILELGDVLWYVANLAQELGESLQNVADENVSKLQTRKERNTLHGEGDER